MQVRQETRGGQLILTPDDSLMCGGRAEQFESVLQEVIAAGHRHLIVDLVVGRAHRQRRRARAGARPSDRP